MLTKRQSFHVRSVYPECRDAMASFLEGGVKVFVTSQNECGTDVPPFAIRVVDQPDFWIDCASSAQSAAALAIDLGLRVVDVNDVEISVPPRACF